MWACRSWCRRMASVMKASRAAGERPTSIDFAAITSPCHTALCTTPLQPGRQQKGGHGRAGHTPEQLSGQRERGTKVQRSLPKRAGDRPEMSQAHSAQPCCRQGLRSCAGSSSRWGATGGRSPASPSAAPHLAPEPSSCSVPSGCRRNRTSLRSTTQSASTGGSMPTECAGPSMGAGWSPDELAAVTAAAQMDCCRAAEVEKRRVASQAATCCASSGSSAAAEPASVPAPKLVPGEQLGQPPLQAERLRPLPLPLQLCCCASVPAT